MTARGPAIVVVPMDDWLAPAPAPHEVFGAARVLRSEAADAEVVEELAALLDDAGAPVIVSGAGADSPEGWAAMVALAERLGCPVWQEPFGPQAGFPQDHPQFAGHLPARRARLRDALAPHDTVLVVGTGMLRQYPYDEGPLVAPGTRVAVISQDAAEAHRSPVDLSVLGAPAAVCAALADAVTPRPAAIGTPFTSRPPAPAPPASGEPLRVAHVLAALGDRLPRDTILVEESPSSRQQLNAHIPAREPMGFVSAMGLLGFGMPASIGLKLARPQRPVMAVLGDGSSLYSIQALWSAVQYGAGVVFVILVNGGYAIMDRLSEQTGQAGPWPALAGLDIGGFARAQGCETQRVRTHDDLLATFDEIVPGLAGRETPLLLEAIVAQDPTFDA